MALALKEERPILFMLNALFFSQAFFSFFSGLVPIVKTFAANSVVTLSSQEPTDDASAIVQES
jgi:hypothetical protein